MQQALIPFSLTLRASGTSLKIGRRRIWNKRDAIYIKARGEAYSVIRLNCHAGRDIVKYAAKENTAQ